MIRTEPCAEQILRRDYTGLKPYRRLHHSLSLTTIPDPEGCGVLTHIVDPPHSWPALGPSPLNLPITWLEM